MAFSKPMIACPSCATYWTANARPSCNDPAHLHTRFELHMHRTAIALPDGTPVVPVSFDPDDPYTRDTPPDFGLYLDDRWQPPWTHDHVAWPDFGTPRDAKELEAALTSLLDRAHDGQRVELGCLGGHGRTGTALACLAVMTGTPSNEAVAWVRATYCDRAIESTNQEEFVATFTRR
jgi:hypothetical protein